MKKIYLMLMLLMVGIAANAQRNIQVSVRVDTPTTSFNIITGSTVVPVYTVVNLGPDTLRGSDTLIFQHSGSDTNAYITVWTNTNIPPSTAIKLSGASTGLALLKVPFANIKTLYPSSGPLGSRLLPPYTNNTKYAWYAWVRGIVPRTGTGTLTFNTASSLDTAHIWINKSTGLVEFANNKIESISTYPNPATTQLSFDYNFTNKENATAKILDVTGRTVFVKEYDNNIGNQKFDLDINSLSNGAYILQFMVGDKTMMSKFNVQK